MRLGATPVTCADDVLELFDLVRAKSEPASVGDTAQEILARLRDGARTGDELARLTGIEPSAASAALVELELARQVELEDGVYRACV